MGENLLLLVRQMLFLDRSLNSKCQHDYEYSVLLSLGHDQQQGLGESPRASAGDSFLWTNPLKGSSQWQSVHEKEQKFLALKERCGRLFLSVLTDCSHHWQGEELSQLPSGKTLEYLPPNVEELWSFTIGFVIRLMLLKLQCFIRSKLWSRLCLLFPNMTL